MSGWSCKVHLKAFQVSYGNMLTEMLYILTLHVLVAVERLISLSSLFRNSILLSDQMDWSQVLLVNFWLPSSDDEFL